MHQIMLLSSFMLRRMVFTRMNSRHNCSESWSYGKWFYVVWSHKNVTILNESVLYKAIKSKSIKLETILLKEFDD